MGPAPEVLAYLVGVTGSNKGVIHGPRLHRVDQIDDRVSGADAGIFETRDLWFFVGASELWKRASDEATK